MRQLSAATCAALFLLAAPACHASSFSPGRYSAAPGERNELTLTVADGRVTARDAGADILAGPSCDAADAHTVSCPLPRDPGYAMTVDLADGDDVLHSDDGMDLIRGGDGNDEIHGGGGSDTIAGGPGNDLLEGGGGDRLGRYDPLPTDGTTGTDPDTLDGGPGADLLQGGGGDFDRVDYGSRTQPVSVTFDGQANDGEAGEGDLVAGDVEDVRGGSGNDVLLGSPGPNSLEGMGGDDLVDGGGGYQDIGDGGDGNDVIRLLDGGAESLRGIDGPIPGFKFDDIARCDSWERFPEPGDDTAFVDPTDAGQAGQLSQADKPCEHVYLAAAPQRLPVQHGIVTLPVACGAGPAATSCQGDAVVRLPKHGSARTPKLGRRVARRHFRSRLGRRSKARVRLNRAGRRTTRHGRLRAWVVYRYGR
jgi:hypothetical protein